MWNLKIYRPLKWLFSYKASLKWKLIENECVKLAWNSQIVIRFGGFLGRIRVMVRVTNPKPIPKPTPTLTLSLATLLTRNPKFQANFTYWNYWKPCIAFAIYMYLLNVYRTFFASIIILLGNSPTHKTFKAISNATLFCQKMQISFSPKITLLLSTDNTKQISVLNELFSCEIFLIMATWNRYLLLNAGIFIDLMLIEYVCFEIKIEVNATYISLCLPKWLIRKPISIVSEKTNEIVMDIEK